MTITTLTCGLTILSSAHGAVTSSGARYAIAEADGLTIIETAPSRAVAHVRAAEITGERQAEVIALDAAVAMF